MLVLTSSGASERCKTTSDSTVIEDGDISIMKELLLGGQRDECTTKQGSESDPIYKYHISHTGRYTEWFEAAMASGNATLLGEISCILELMGTCLQGDGRPIDLAWGHAFNAQHHDIQLSIVR